MDGWALRLKEAIVYFSIFSPRYIIFARVTIKKNWV